MRACVLLAHQPRGIELADELGVDLQLSGHTHGRQIFPWNFAVRLQQPFVAGLHRLARAQVYVSRGAGYWVRPCASPRRRRGKNRTITRRAFGFHGSWSLIALIFLCCSGITVPLPSPLPNLSS